MIEVTSAEEGEQPREKSLGPEAEAASRDMMVRLAPEDISAIASAIAGMQVRLAREDIVALSAEICKGLHEKFRSPNFQFDVLQRLPYSRDSAAYASEHMGAAMKIPGKDNHLKYVLQYVGEGLILEFGVFKGHSINVIADALPEREIHGFDSFEGLPEDWTGYNVAKEFFDREGKLPKVRKNVILHKGWFNESLPPFVQERTDTVGFIHVDCDLYSSTKTIFDALAARIRPGTVIAFDEYHNFPYWRDHEHKAFMEFCDEWDVKYKYISYNNLQAAAQIISIGKT